jgi:hypothetical protein
MEESRKMNLTPVSMASRSRVLQALGVTPLRLRSRPANASVLVNPVPAAAAPSAVSDKRIALLRAQAEIEQPALATLYTRITEAISALGLQCVRQADAENDPRVRVLAFGEVPLPAGIEAARVLRVDALATMESDRVRKRALWELMQRLAREAGAG